MWLLAGCGQTTDSVSGEASETRPSAAATESGNEEIPLYMTDDNAGDPSAQRVSVLEGRSAYDLLSDPWQPPRKATPAALWWNQTAYVEDLLQDPQDMTSSNKFRAVEGKDYYILAVYDSFDEEQEKWTGLYYLNQIDGDTLQTRCHQLYLEEAQENGPYVITSLDIAEGSPILFMARQDPQSRQILEYRAVWFDSEGHVESSLDLLPALREAGLYREDEYFWNNAAKWDSRGYYCVRGAGDEQEYAVLDKEGQLVTIVDPQQDMGEVMVNLYHDSQGRCIWETVSFKDLCNVFWGVQEGEQKKLCESSYQNVGSRYVNAYGDLYYIQNNNLVRWDASTGSCETLYVGGSNAFGECRELLQDSSGAILLFYDDGIRDYLFRIANEDIERIKLTLANYGFMDYYSRGYVSEFCRLHPNIRIDIQDSSWEERENDWARVQTDLAAGNGPDLLIADLAHLAVLQEKGALTELSQVLDQKAREQIFPGALEAGRIDDGLYGIAYAAAPSTLIVAEEVWGEDTWTWEDMVSLLEQRETAGDPVQYVLNPLAGNTQSGFYLLNYVFLSDLEHCSLLDLEAGKAYFDTEEFCHLLEVCRRYAQKEENGGSSIYSMEDRVAEECEMLKNGEILCYDPDTISGFRWFSMIMASLGEGYNLVGYPTEGDSGNGLYCYGCVAVNSATEYPELAAEFVNYIVSRKAQESSDVPVRRDIYTDRVSEHVDYKRPDGKPIVFLRIAQGAMEIPGKPDGSSYLPEYLEYMESCRTSSDAANPIRDILQEETEAFFAGDKDAQTVAGIIQSRVQLYLNENGSAGMR